MNTVKVFIKKLHYFFKLHFMRSPKLFHIVRSSLKKLILVEYLDSLTERVNGFLMWPCGNFDIMFFISLFVLYSLGYTPDIWLSNEKEPVIQPLALLRSHCSSFIHQLNTTELTCQAFLFCLSQVYYTVSVQHAGIWSADMPQCYSRVQVNKTRWHYKTK